MDFGGARALRRRIGSRIESLFGRHFDKVYSYVAYRLAPDREAAEEITQEVFLAAAERLSDLDGRASAVSWLRSVARHKAADYFRSKTARPTTEDVDVEVAQGRSSPTDHETEIQGQARLTGIVMQNLPDKYVALLEEKYIEGLSVREMAERRSITEKSVESALSRARDAFRSRFQVLKSQTEHEK